MPGENGASVNPRLVTVDGPAGSGKSTLGRRLAQTLHLPFVDTGLFYRGITVAAVRAGAEAAADEVLAALAERTRLSVRTDPWRPPGAGELLVDGAEAWPLLRDPKHAPLLSRVSSIPAIRATLLERQRALAVAGAVAVGRDCGTVVFPNAPVKIYLQAAPEVRVQRRARQLGGADRTLGDETLDAEIRGRDRIDSSRSTAPLRPAPDAHTIDTEALGIDEMVERALALCAEAGLIPA